MGKVPHLAGVPRLSGFALRAAPTPRKRRAPAQSPHVPTTSVAPAQRWSRGENRVAPRIGRDTARRGWSRRKNAFCLLPLIALCALCSVRGVTAMEETLPESDARLTRVRTLEEGN